MVNSNYKSAIIGLDAQFINHNSVQEDIDRVERALYSGKNCGQTLSKEQADIFQQTKITINGCQQAVERMALANHISCADIKKVVISQDVSFVKENAENTLLVSSLAQAMVQISNLIADGNLVALVGTSLGQLDTENDELAPIATISIDDKFTGYAKCNGIAAILFSSVEFAQSNHCYVYSWLKGFALGAEIADVTSSALDNAQVGANDIGLLEISALSDKAKDESNALISSYELGEKLTTAIACARSVTGEGEAFSQVMGLLRTVIALQQRYIPAITDWQQPDANELEQWHDSSFYFATESRPWYPNADGSAHLAAYSCLANNHDYCHLILQENKAPLNEGKHSAEDIRVNGFIACSDLQLVLITGNSQQSLLSQLIEIEDELDSTLIMASDNKLCTVKDIALSRFAQFQSEQTSYTIALLCETAEELVKEIQLAKSGIELAFSNDSEWRTPKGSYFTARPVNSDSENNNVSFLYPGIGATYVGLGRDLFHLFPEIHQDVANLADDIGASLKDKLLNPRTIVRPNFKALKQLDLNLRGNLADIAEAGVGFACVFTKVFENVFKVKADFATGYSMGEVSMYAALGAWQQPGLMSARLANSQTFNQRLCGDLLTLREHWGLPEPSATDDELIWETYTIKSTLDAVLAACEGEERVYCTIINTPDSLLVAGYPEDCLRVIKKLGVRAMPLNMANAIHSAPAKFEYDDMVELYSMDVTSRLHTKMYSSSCYLPIPQLSKAIAHSVAKCLCERVDFPRLINTMHDKGARVFIEMGPGRSLCSWVDKILDFSSESVIETERNSRVAVPVNAKGTSDELTYLRAIAKLVSHGVKLDLHRLFYGSIIVHKE